VDTDTDVDGCKKMIFVSRLEVNSDADIREKSASGGTLKCRP